jgi:hypothetical protein
MDRFDFDNGLTMIRYPDISYRYPNYVDISPGSSSYIGMRRRF